MSYVKLIKFILFFCAHAIVIFEHIVSSFANIWLFAEQKPLKSQNPTHLPDLSGL